MENSYTFTLPQGKGAKRVNINSITIRETTGDDEDFATTLAEAKGKRGSVALELLRLSIVKINGQSAQQPFADLDHWNSRTRRFALDAWQSINAIDEKEGDAFLESATLDENSGAEVVSLSSERG